MYHIDGSTGGGSVLRIAVPIALAQQKDINILNIRKGRSTSGLRTQHLEGLQLLCKITGSEMKGGRIGSEEINIKSGNERIEEIDLHIPTAGSISLVYQLLSNYCLMADSKIKVNFTGGGTHTQWSPNFDYLEQVTIPALAQFGQQGNLEVEKFGYYPKGGAKGSFDIRQIQTPGTIDWTEFTDERSMHVISRASTNLKQASVAERQIQGLEEGGLSIASSEVEYNVTKNPGTSITVWMRSQDNTCYRGFSELGKKGKPAEAVGKDVAKTIKYSKYSAVDEFLADQLIVALSQSYSGSRLPIPSMTDHVGTNFNLINYMLAKPIAMKHENGQIILLKN